MKRAIVILLSTLLTVSMFSFKKEDPKPVAKIEWLTLDEAYKRSLKEPRKIYVDMYTEWCGWCKVQDKKTFTSPPVIDILNKKYYAVKFNPELDKDVTFGKKSFNAIMAGSVQGYPTSAFLDEKYNLIQAISSYLEAKDFHQISIYFADEHNKKEAFNDFVMKTYPKYVKDYSATAVKPKVQ